MSYGMQGQTQSMQKDRNPDSIPSRLEQALDGLDRTLAQALSIREKLFGSTPEAINQGSNNRQGDLSMSQQLESIQARITDLNHVLEGILKSF